SGLAGARAMSPIVPIHRVRLELDRMLRARPFIARAIRGKLPDAALRDLVAQLGALVTTTVGDGEAARSDTALALRETPESPCVAIRIFGTAVRSQRPFLDEAIAHDVLLAVMGTSWT